MLMRKSSEAGARAAGIQLPTNVKLSVQTKSRLIDFDFKEESEVQVTRI